MSTPITTQWGTSIQCKLDYLINMIMWQNGIICHLKEKIDNQDGACCGYIAPCEDPIEFTPPCVDDCAKDENAEQSGEIGQ